MNSRFYSLFVLVLMLSLGSPTPRLFGAEIIYPQLSDDRLQITLYASDPDIVTPIGAACDAQGRLYVIESHTHNPPQNYPGPKGDLIKVFEGVGEDGRYDRMRVFADGIFQAQALAFDPDGTLYVVCTREVLILHDRDKDGRSESRTRILHLDPYEKRGNPHGQMQGIAFSNDGWLYVATGTTSDDWISSDGRRLSVGPYWGGIIARCQPDGSRLERVAWGFWNPYSLTFDRHGRLLAIDNDPDHRGPNRLLHILMGGDYGFKRQYGRYGLHPYQAWHGELPGTLPMIAGVGEAPTAVLDANAAALPLEYRDTILASTWGEHNLTLYRTRPSGTSMTASEEVWIEGRGHDDLVSPFRPSGMAASPVDGSIYVSDWMLIDYTTHMRGRVWRISAKPDVVTSPPRKPYAPQATSSEMLQLDRLAEANKSEEFGRLRQALLESDPFVRSAALNALARPVFRDATIRALQDRDAKVRLGALLALRRADVANPVNYIMTGLKDPAIAVVQMAMIWAGEKELRQLLPEIDAAAARAGLTERFFEIWLATMNILEPRATVGSAAGASDAQASSAIPSYRRNRQPSPEFIERLAHDEARPSTLRALALRWLQNLESSRNHRLLATKARQSEPEIQVEAIRRLGDSAHSDAKVVLVEVAFDQRQSSVVRTEALAALAGKPDSSLVSLLRDPDRNVQLEAARSLRLLASDPSVREALQQRLSTLEDESRDARLRSQLSFLLDPSSVARPERVSEWQRLLGTGGDPAAGRRVFFSANSACVSCHTAEGRGGRLGRGASAGFVAMPLGPDLSVVARSADRNALIHAIIRPSDDIAPEYQGWYVDMNDGERYTGREIDQERNAIQLIMMNGHERNFPREQIESWGAMKLSLMPEGIPQTMAIEEFRDLIAYLGTLK